MAQYRVLGLGGKPTDASMIFNSNPYKEMANIQRRISLTDSILNFFLHSFFRLTSVYRPGIMCILAVLIGTLANTAFTVVFFV